MMETSVKIMIVTAAAITVIAVVGIIASTIEHSNEIAVCQAAGGVSVTFLESEHRYKVACVNPDIFVKVK
jgi:hypothetical protein